MAGDAIFSEDDLEGGITLSAEQWTALENERKEFKTQVADLHTKLDGAQQLLENATQAQPAATPTPDPNKPVNPANMNADEALAMFAKDPKGFTQLIANGQINRVIAEQFAPLMNPMIASVNNNIMQSERAAFDIKFGPGKFDDLVMPKLSEDLQSLTATNSNALGDANTVKALIERITGTMRVELNEAESAFGKTRDDQEKAGIARVVATLPASMRPKPEGGTKELSNEAVEMFDAIERATGERPSDDRFIATDNAKPGVDGFVTAMKALENPDNKDGASV